MIRFFLGGLLGLPLVALAVVVFVAWACAKGETR